MSSAYPYDFRQQGTADPDTPATAPGSLLSSRPSTRPSTKPSWSSQLSQRAVHTKIPSSVPTEATLLTQSHRPGPPRQLMPPPSSQRQTPSLSYSRQTTASEPHSSSNGWAGRRTRDSEVSEPSSHRSSRPGEGNVSAEGSGTVHSQGSRYRRTKGTSNLSSTIGGDTGEERPRGTETSGNKSKDRRPKEEHRPRRPPSTHDGEQTVGPASGRRHRRESQPVPGATEELQEVHHSEIVRSKRKGKPSLFLSSEGPGLPPSYHDQYR